MKLADSSESIDFVIRSRSPDLKLAIDTFKELVEKDFPKCITFGVFVLLVVRFAASPSSYLADLH